MTACLLIQLSLFGVEVGLGKDIFFSVVSVNYLPIHILKCVILYLHKQVHPLLNYSFAMQLVIPFSSC